MLREAASPATARTPAQRTSRSKDELLLRTGVDPVGLPALLIRRQPDLPALLTQRGDGGILSAHRSDCTALLNQAS